MKPNPSLLAVATSLMALSTPLSAQDRPAAAPERAPGAERQEAAREARRPAMERRMAEMRRREMMAQEAQKTQKDRPREADSKAPWIIGLGVDPLDPFVRSHLDIPENTGVRVSMVAPGSPAAAAGIKENDILLSANERKLNSLATLKEAVLISGREGKALHLELLHEGKRKNVKIEAPRPERPREAQPEARQGDIAPERRIAEMARNMERQEQEIQKLREQIERMRAMMEKRESR